MWVRLEGFEKSEDDGDKRNGHSEVEPKEPVFDVNHISVDLAEHLSVQLHHVCSKMPSAASVDEQLVQRVGLHRCDARDPQDCANERRGYVHPIHEIPEFPIVQELLKTEPT